MNNFEKLQEIFREVFDKDDLIIGREMTSEDIEGWDSLAQMQLTSNAEMEFGVQFSLDDLLSFQRVGDFLDCIEAKL